MYPVLRSALQVASITLSRSTAPVEVREPLTLRDWSTLLATYVPAVREWAILSTCHRFELYVVAEIEKLDTVCADLKQMLATVITSYCAYDFDASPEPWVLRLESSAAEHLCRVAAGLDSLVLGEAQIQGQVISTYTDALEAGTIGPLLSTLFRSAIRVGKRARTETNISTRAVSMSSVALSMAARYFDDFAERNVLVIGAGEMSRLALKALEQRGVKHVTVANRTWARAQAVLLTRAWRAVPLDQVPMMLGDFDVIFSATSAMDLVISQEQVVAAQSRQDDTRRQVLQIGIDMQRCCN